MANQSGEEIICPNGTPISKIRFAAINNWAGLVYQGLCALCVAIEKLIDVKDACDWYLNVEGYEDFAILNENKQILSFHQCKDYKKSGDMTAEFRKMEDKRWYWSTRKHLCEIDVPLYIHAKEKYAYSNGVTPYKYKTTNASVASIKDVNSILTSIVKEYIDKNNLPGGTQRRRNALVSLIEDKVIELDELGKDHKLGKGEMQDISISKSIPFSLIKGMLDRKEEESDVLDRIRTSIYYINIWMSERLSLNPSRPTEYINNFLQAIKKLDFYAQKAFIKRLFPDYDIENTSPDSNILTEISSRSRINNLFNVLTNTDPLDLYALNWVNRNIKQSPSTLGKDMSTREHCQEIYKNRHHIPELFNDYNYIVGDVDDSVEDIIEAVSSIMDAKDDDDVNQQSNEEDEIDKLGKLGILTIKDKNRL